MTADISKTYNHNKEADIYKQWEKSGAFQPDLRKLGKNKKNYFSIIMPPPNSNGSLHIGHAVFITLEDVMVRYHRLAGDATLWLPGADHAGFETQVVYQKKLEKEGKNWYKIPRSRLFSEIKKFTLRNKIGMEKQLKRLGASCDWSREKFTLDEDIVKIVYQTFKELYDDGLIYRDARIVNWCVKHQTTLSDLEIKYVEQKDPLYFLKYGPLELATVRPETKFGDTAIAVNPKDKRYQKYVGREIEIDTLIGKAKIKVIADKAVDPEFGTGAVKVTPAHDPNDFEIWRRHRREIPGPKIAIDRFGKLTKIAGPYAGMNVKDARQKIAKDMAAKGLLDESKTDYSYQHSVATCYKCKRTIEPTVMRQWFVAMNKKSKRLKKSLRELGVEAVKSGEVKFVTKKFEKIYLHWLKNLHDWNISRQIVWGIRMPVWYCSSSSRSSNRKISPKTTCPPIITADKPPRKCPNCGGAKLTQESDVFDTWFSSGQWTFAPLMTTNSNHPNKKERERDFKTFYPTTVMETGHDILFFWVARMIMLGKYKTGKAPFSYVFLHGLVRDKDRQKMSKSKGNVVDPLGVVADYGADALRMALVLGTAAGNDIIVSQQKIKGMRNFTNKVWNIGRFIAQCDRPERLKQNRGKKAKEIKAAECEKWAKSWLGRAASEEKKIKEDIENFKFHEAALKLYNWIWHQLADKMIEESKKYLESGGGNSDCAQKALLEAAEKMLKLLHPFMPFVSEAVWQELGKRRRTNKEPLLINSRF